MRTLVEIFARFEIAACLKADCDTTRSRQTWAPNPVESRHCDAAETDPHFPFATRVQLLDRAMPRRTAINRVAKNIVDYGLVLLALPVILPLMLVLALLIKLDSPGPVFYRQARYGLDSTVFSLIKFRTLYADRCDPSDGAFKQVGRDDPRVTRVGRFLRRSCMDELPQVFNVLRGEMSLVGPRPHGLAQADAHAANLNGYVLRRLVMPGITGWAQVNGLHGEIPSVSAMARVIQYDLEYVQSGASVWLDFVILATTPLAIVRGRYAAGFNHA